MAPRLPLMLWMVLTAGAVRLLAHDPLGFDGTVVKMDGKKGVLTIQVVENGQRVSVDLTLDSKMAKTTITQAGKKVSRSALKPGMHVKVAALGCIDEVEVDAVDVQILPPGPGAPPESAMHMAMPMNMPMPGGSAAVELGTEIPAGDRVPTVALHADGFKNGAWSFTVETSLVLTDAMTMKPYQPMHGHLHVYLDGREILMIATKHFTLKDLAPGTHTVRVALSGTDHRTLLHDGRPIADSREIVVTASGQ